MRNTSSMLSTRSRIRLKLLLDTLIWIHLVNRLHDLLNKDPINPISTTLNHMHLTQIHVIHIYRLIQNHPLGRDVLRTSQTRNKVSSTNPIMWQRVHSQARKIKTIVKGMLSKTSLWIRHHILKRSTKWTLSLSRQ